MIDQLGGHVAALVACGAFLLFRARARWWIDVVVAAMLTCSLVKPTISVPLVIAVLIVSGRVRPAALVALAYAASRRSRPPHSLWAVVLLFLVVRVEGVGT